LAFFVTIDSDGVAPLIEAFDYDCSLAAFHGETMPVKSLMFVFSDFEQDPCTSRRGKRVTDRTATPRNAALRLPSSTSVSPAYRNRRTSSAAASSLVNETPAGSFHQ
jgi:hypothetical protein